MKTFEYMQTAPNGALLIDDTNAHTDDGYAVVIREDTVIAAWTDEDSRDLVAYFGISGKTLKVTDPMLIIPGQNGNGSITLTSGSLWLMK
jgi:hypothetical protein